MSDGKTFALSGRAVAALVIGGLLVAALTFLAGWILGSRHGEEPPPAVPASEDGTAAAAPGAAEAGPEPDSGPESGPESAADSWTVRVGAFLEPAEAEVLGAVLAEHGYEPRPGLVETGDGRRVHTVEVGAFADRSQAVESAAEIAGRDGLRTVVVSVRRRPAAARVAEALAAARLATVPDPPEPDPAPPPAAPPEPAPVPPEPAAAPAPPDPTTARR